MIHTIDTRVATAAVALYFALAAALLPPAEYPRALGGGMLVFGVVAAAARRLGRGPLSPVGILAVDAGAVLLVPALVVVMVRGPCRRASSPSASWACESGGGLAGRVGDSA